MPEHLGAWVFIAVLAFAALIGPVAWLLALIAPSYFRDSRTGRRERPRSLRAALAGDVMAVMGFMGIGVAVGLVVLFLVRPPARHSVSIL